MMSKLHRQWFADGVKFPTVSLVPSKQARKRYHNGEICRQITHTNSKVLRSLVFKVFKAPGLRSGCMVFFLGIKPVDCRMHPTQC